jgi:multidrug efflux pump subunit AcrA (membrane-fusion protein)
MKKNKKIKITVITIALLIVIAAVLLITRKVIASKSDSTTTYTVRQETYEDTIDIAGDVSAANEQTLQAQDDGTVIAVYVKEGDHVKKGDVILQMDDTTQQYNLANEDYLIAQKRVTGSEKEIELMQKQRASLVQKVQDRKVIATFDGVIAELDAAVGDYFEAKDTIGTLVDLSYLKATVEVAETDVSRLKIGQKVNFTFPAYTEKTVEGYLVSYPAIGEVTTRGVTVVNAEVRIDDYPSTILPNYSFTGTIQVSDPQTLLVVERNAIGYENGKAYVEVINKDGSTTKTDITLKPYSTSYVNILSGLSGGETLKQLSKNSISGRLKNNKDSSSTKKNNNQQNDSGFGGPPGGGMGGGGGMPGM